MIRPLQRWWFTRALTRIAIELAAARERADDLEEELTGYLDWREVPPDAFYDERHGTRLRIAALTEKLDYVRVRLAAVS